MLLRREFLGAVGLAAFGSIKERSVKVETVYKSPGPAPNGLQATSEGLWVLDQKDNHAYLVEYESGKILRKLKTDSVAGSGITFDGDALWIASTYSREILRSDAKTGATLARHPSPGAGVVHWKPEEARRSALAPPPKPAPPPDPSKATAPRTPTGAHGLEWGAGKLYISNPPSMRIYRVEPKTFTVEFDFPTAGNRPHGLGWEGDYLWAADSNYYGFHKYDPKNGKVVEAIKLADSDPQPHGASIWKGYMWYCDEMGVVCRFKL